MANRMEIHSHTMYSNLKAGRDSINRVSTLIDTQRMATGLTFTWVSGGLCVSILG